MVRHLFEADPSIFIDDRSLGEIADSGLAPIQRYINQWTADTVRAEYEKMLETVFLRETPQLAHARWFTRLAEIDARERTLQQSEAAARQAEAVARQAAVAAQEREDIATRRANEDAAASADRDRLLLHTLRSDLEMNSRSLRLGLYLDRLSRAILGSVKRSLGPSGSAVVRKIMRIGRS